MASSEPVRWQVHPHDPINKLEDNLWEVQGNLPGGAPLRRRMVVVRLAGGQLLIHNGIALEEAAMAELERWGKPAVLVVPNGSHRLDASAYKSRYNELRVYCPAAGHDRVSQRVAVDGHFDALPAETALRVETLAGVKNGEAVFVVRSSSGRVTLIFTDAVFNIPHGSGPKGWLLRLLGASGGPKVSAIMRLTAVGDRAALARHLRQLADEPGLSRIIVSHGDILEAGAAAALRGVADGLQG